MDLSHNRHAVLDGHVADVVQGSRADVKMVRLPDNVASSKTQNMGDLGSAVGPSAHPEGNPFVAVPTVARHLEQGLDEGSAGQVPHLDRGKESGAQGCLPPKWS